jgi:hypothetical protein
MKVKIGPYTSNLVNFRNLERKYEAYRAKKLGIPFFSYEPVTKADRAVENTVDFLERLFLPVNRYWNSRKRKINVQIHDYDVWDVEHTLSLIIVPVLHKLREKKNGSPHVDLEDVPEHLRNEGDFHERWEWVLDEMIWAFEQHRNDDWENQYYHNDDQLEITFKKIPDSSNSELLVNYQKDITKAKYWYDQDGAKAHSERMDNGRRLFAKYYNGLWD